MFKKKRGKKGISPLIATVLLIGFTIVLALLVWVWFQNFIVDQSQKQGEIVQGQLSCATGIDFNIQKSCYDQSKDVIQLTIDNGANNDIEAFIVRVSSSTDTNVDVFEIPKRVGALNVEVIEIFPSSVSFPDNAIVIPRLRTSGGVVSCSEQAIQTLLDFGC